MSLKKVFSNSFETASVGTDEVLLTHIYANDYDHTKDAVLSVLKQLDYMVEDINDEYKEILASKSNVELIITLFNNTYYETSVDMKVTTTYAIPFGRGYKAIKAVYDALPRLLTLKNVGNKQ